MNRRYLLIIACIFFIAPSCLGQLYVGPKAGIQAFAPFYPDKDNRAGLKLKPRPGLSLGLAAVAEVRENFALHFEIAYSQKGKKVKDKISPLLSHKVLYNHIDFPILFTRRFNAKFGGQKAYQWYLNVGPNISYWLGGSGELISDELEEENVARLDYKIVFKADSFDNDQANIEEPNRLQLGLNVGGGLIFKPNDANMLLVDFRLEIGSTFVGKKGTAVEFPYSMFAYTDNLATVNVGLKASVAYVFDLNLAQLKKGKSTKDSRRRR